MTQPFSARIMPIYLGQSNSRTMGGLLFLRVRKEQPIDTRVEPVLLLLKLSCQHLKLRLQWPPRCGHATLERTLGRLENRSPSSIASLWAMSPGRLVVGYWWLRGQSIPATYSASPGFLYSLPDTRSTACHHCLLDILQLVPQPRRARSSWRLIKTLQMLPPPPRATCITMMEQLESRPGTVQCCKYLVILWIGLLMIPVVPTLSLLTLVRWLLPIMANLKGMWM
uniref:p25 protein n=1 Tax=Hibiscus chlorotic ringspot virus TaxID=53181 RepID=Q27K36_9TOMB|nr:p25 protein [Hibiscus chlorotic ringspot virus]